MDEADQLYQSALAARDPRSAEGLVVMEVYAAFLRSQDRQDQASEIETRAADIRKAAASPQPALAEDVYRIGHGVTPPSPVHKLEPQYSDEARAAKLQGTVVVQVVIGTDGMVHDAQVVRAVGLGLDENAIEAIHQWQFKPGAKDGQPVKVSATIEVNFRLL